MDRRRDERRPARDDARSHRPRYGQERSRSPPRRDRRDDRRRDRSPPPRGPPSSRAGPPSHSDRDRDYPPRNPRDTDRNGATRGSRPGDRQPQPSRDSRDSLDDPKTGTGRKELPSGDASGRDVKMEAGMEDSDSEAEMQRLMGFKAFRTTKNTKVPGNERNYGVYKVKKAEYRQYMNRVGGFNRPLSPSRM